MRKGGKREREERSKEVLGEVEGKGDVIIGKVQSSVQQVLMKLPSAETRLQTLRRRRTRRSLRR